MAVGGIEEDVGALVPSSAFIPDSHAATTSFKRGSTRSVGWRDIAATTSSGTRVGPGEWRRRMPGMRDEAMVRRMLAGGRSRFVAGTSPTLRRVPKR
jgi:hypothetical protein